MHTAMFTVNHTNDILYTVLFIGIENVDVVKYCLIIFIFQNKNNLNRKYLN